MVMSLDESFRDIADIKAHLSNLSAPEPSESKEESSDLLLRPEAMLLRQRLQTLCRSVLLHSLESALNEKIETDLWNFAFKAQITALQVLLKSKPTNARRTELQADFHLLLESSLGFYMQLLEDICETFHLHPPFRRKHSSFGIIQGRREHNRRSQARLPSNTSSMYICQYCLVHLGDIARYLQRISLAENFYNLASILVPSNGQPYNQLAILCSTRSNKLAVTYYYIRSIAVRSPFPVAPTNLEKLYSKQIKDCENTNFMSKNKWTHGEVVTLFLYIHALVHLEVDKEKSYKLAELLHRCLCSQTIFSLLTAQNLTHMVAISIFTLCHIDNSGCEKTLTADEVHFRDVVIGFLTGLLEVLLNQAQKYNVREHMTLPSIKIILEWLICREGYLSSGIVKTHRCWINLAKTLNAIQSHCKDSKTIELSGYQRMPLAEDVELQCFLPLQDCHDGLDFSLTQTLQLNGEDAIRLRCARLVNLGKSFSEKYPSLNLMDYKVNAKNTKAIFTASTAIKVERRRKPNNRNIAIQALKSQVADVELPSAVAETTQEDLPMWPLSGPLGLALSDTSFPPGIDKVSSYSSFQSDVTPTEIGVATAAPVISYALNSRANTADDFLPQCNSPLGLLPGAQANQSAVGPQASQSTVGPQASQSAVGAQANQSAVGAQLSSKSKTLAELIDATSIADPVLQPPSNFSASDSSVFLNQGSSYSLFSPAFTPASSASQAISGDDSALTHSAAFAVGWPASSSQQNVSGLDAAWGNKSALAQLLEEQQKRTNK